MRTIALNDPALVIRGVMEVEQSPTSMKTWRLPLWTRGQSPDPAVDLMAGMASGVRLCFSTDADAFTLRVLETGLQLAGTPRRPVTFDLYLDDILNQQGTLALGHTIVVEATHPRFEPGTASEISFERLGSGLKQVELWLPQSAQVEILGLSISKGAVIAPPQPAKGRRWAHYGSSISHGMEASGPSTTWPAVAARALGSALTNLGLAGQCHLDGFVARALRDGKFDAISLEVGINIIGADTMRRRVFASALHNFLDILREAQPEVPILVISPIYCPLIEDRPGPLVRDSLATYAAADRPLGAADGALSLIQGRAIIADVVARRQNAGDTHLSYLDGLALFGAEDVADMPDKLHPNATGQERMGGRFISVGWPALSG
jgi:lysophospholipase L1-like esterase